MIWALYAKLGIRNVNAKNEALVFEDEAWDIVLNECHKEGINTIVLEVGEGIEWKSHPELSVKNAWSYERVKNEIERCRALGITIIPKLNFSSTHDFWLGEWRFTKTQDCYYEVCRDVIEEAYDLFEHPEYVHLGMDEEDNPSVLEGLKDGLLIIRRGKLFWKDIKFLTDTVLNLGATPWIWSDSCFEHPEEFRKHIPADKVLLSPWHYFAFKKEHYTRIADHEIYRDYYSQPRYKHLGLEFVEDEPFLKLYREQIMPTMNDGYKVVPTTSTFNNCEYNTDDTVDFFKNNAPDGALLGFMAAPWKRTTMQYVNEILKDIRLMGEAKRKYFSDK